VVQDVWITVLRGIPKLRDGSKLRGWLFGIARRTMMDRLRENYAGRRQFEHLSTRRQQLERQLAGS
jgi:DNA-directed RNA polymerase specialized sigma24 family protein